LHDSVDFEDPSLDGRGKGRVTPHPDPLPQRERELDKSKKLRRGGACLHPMAELNSAPTRIKAGVF